MRYIVAGLGNPGEEYEGTRHNAGRVAVQRLAAAWNFPDFRESKKDRALTTGGKMGKAGVDLVLPQTFMNKSGASLGGLIKSKKAAEGLIVVHDDLDLPLGKLKISFGRGPGGHHGVESVIKAVKTKDFVRIRIGVSPMTAKGVARKPVGDKTIDFVIGKFKKPEEDTFKKVLKKVREAVEMILTEGKEQTMGEFNT